jgi:N6-adenosine-specific RNA methylase IME4
MITWKYYDLIYADPPWKVTKIKRKFRPNQKELDYPTLSNEEIEKILAEYDSKLLFLWTTDKFLRAAEHIGYDLGYSLHTRLIWDKMMGVPIPHSIKFSHEYLLWFYKKPFTPVTPKIGWSYRSVITEKSTVHSKKPIKAYEMIEALFPDLTKIELFARNKRDGWSAWGNEIV